MRIKLFNKKSKEEKTPRIPTYELVSSKMYKDMEWKYERTLNEAIVKIHSLEKELNDKEMLINKLIGAKGMALSDSKYIDEEIDR